jgi:hypothetical protein
MINIGGGQEMLAKEIRDCERIIWDDKRVTDAIWERVKWVLQTNLNFLEAGELGEPVNWRDKCQLFDTGIGVLQGERAKHVVDSWFSGRKDEKWVCRGLNERMRFLKYESGQYFRRESSPFLPKYPN